MADLQMKSLSLWNQDRRTALRKLFYERSLQFYVNIVRLYVWIPRGIQEASVRVLATMLRDPLPEAGHTLVGDIHS
jgi:hypothetical protein